MREKELDPGLVLDLFWQKIRISKNQDKDQDNITLHPDQNLNYQSLMATIDLNQLHLPFKKTQKYYLD